MVAFPEENMVLHGNLRRNHDKLVKVPSATVPRAVILQLWTCQLNGHRGANDELEESKPRQHSSKPAQSALARLPMQHLCTVAE
jgi:hypothetical protein